MSASSYLTDIQAWRRQYAENLASPDGWLAVSGLFWLQEGENLFGSDPSSQITLPEGSAPAQAGVFTLREGQVTLQCAKGVQMTLNDQPITKTEIALSEYGSSEWIVLNDLKISVIQRGTRLGVRIFDKNNPSLKYFVYLRWFPVQEPYRIQARFVSHSEPVSIQTVNVLGDPLEMNCPGYAEFELQGETCRLSPIETDDGRLWFMFLDATSGKETYSGGRYMTSTAPEEGLVTLDFNKAHNPPCAYTDFATCPLPPPNNHLPVVIKAGELQFRTPHIVHA
ncbi:MAG: DUF1684 domain-containing protein [Chloroflexota bacterium]